MKTRPQWIEYYRTALRARPSTLDEPALPDVAGAEKEFAKLMAALFELAVVYELGGEPTEAQVAALSVSVANELRSSPWPVASADVTALIEHALHRDRPVQVSPQTVGAVEAAVIFEVLGNADLTEHELNAALQAAAQLADVMLDLELTAVINPGG